MTTKDLTKVQCSTTFFQSANLVFFVLTSQKLFETWRLTKLANLENSSSNEFRISPRTQRNSNNFKVIFKIFVIMGLTWFSELFGFLLSWVYGRENVWKYFVLNDIINLLQGVLIFIALICKPTVLGRCIPENWKSLHFVMPRNIYKKKISTVSSNDGSNSKTEHLRKVSQTTTTSNFG